ARSAGVRPDAPKLEPIWAGFASTRVPRRRSPCRPDRDLGGRDEPGGGRLGTRSEPEQRLVQRHDEPAPRPVQKCLDERASDRVLGVGARTVPVEERTQRGQKLTSLAAALTEQDGGAHRGRPGPLLTAEQRSKGLAKLVGTNRPLMEQ